MELQKKHAENKKIAKIFLDSYGQHLIANTEAGETFYFNVQNSKSGKGRPVTRLHNLYIESVAWNSEGTPATTREILIGTRDGTIMETYLEISEYIPNARYLRQVRDFGTPIIGLHVERQSNSDARDVIIATRSAVTVFSGKVTRKNGDIAPAYNTFFEDAKSGRFDDSSGTPSNSRFSILPRTTSEPGYFAWTTSLGVFHGPLHSAKIPSDDTLFTDTTLLPYKTIFPDYKGTSSVLPSLSQYHLLLLHENTFVAVNRLSNQTVHRDRLAWVPSPSSPLT
jgi:vacuolar protein sorting-associated protein 18